MKQGRTLAELGAELERQRNARKDYLVNTSALSMKTQDGKSIVQFENSHEMETYRVGDIAHQQLATRLGIPFRYYLKMQKDYPALLDENVNGWLHKEPERRMLRTLDGRMRAFLSARYRRLDNLELCAAVLPIIHEMKGADIESCEVTESHMYIKVVNKKLKAEVAVGDVVQAGFVVSNSEVGLGSLKVEPLIFRLVCKNGLICKDYSQKKYHVGKQVDMDADEAYELYSDETLRADDKAFFMKVQDFVIAKLNGDVLDPSNFSARTFKKYLKQAGITSEFRVHDLRHTHITWLLEAGVNIKVISQRAGHASTRITLDTYSHVMPSMQDAAVEALDKISDELQGIKESAMEYLVS